MEFLTNLFNGLDPEVMPELDGLFEKLVPLAKIAVMVAPLALLVLGVIYLFLAPKEANHLLGFRCWWGMGSVEVWQFTQKLAGIVWTAMGLVMSIVMFVISLGYTADAPMDMMTGAIIALVWELALVITSILAINIVLIVLYDRKGVKRSEKKTTAGK